MRRNRDAAGDHRDAGGDVLPGVRRGEPAGGGDEHGHQPGHALRLRWGRPAGEGDGGREHDGVHRQLLREAGDYRHQVLLPGGQRVAMRVGPAGQAGTVSYLHGDHLGSTSLATNGSGQEVLNSRTRYYPYGGIRGGGEGLPTDYTFTGQWSDGDVRLVHMGARWYDPQIGRWMSADTIVPDPTNPQSLNRYSYVLGNPLKFSDPTGHIEACGAYGQSCNESPPPPSPIETLDEVEEWLLATMFDNSHSDVVNEIYRDLGSSDTRTVIRAYQLWIEQVKTEGPWDFKRYVHRRWKGGVWLADCGWWSYETVANIHYGYVGMAAGFMDVELLGGAGAAQVKDHFFDLLLAGKSPDWGAIGTLQTYFDDPEDQAAIRIGIDLYNQRKNIYQPITHAEFKAAFRPHASQLKPGPAPTWLRQIMGLKVSD